MDFSTSMTVAASGMRAQSERMKTIAENIANANSTVADAGRRSLSPQDRHHHQPISTANWAPPSVEAGQAVTDKSDFRSQYDPGNPNADKQGYVKLPNVDSLVEIMDMREAQRSYEADLTVMDATKQMLAAPSIF